MNTAARSFAPGDAAAVMPPHGRWLACSSSDLREELANHTWTLVEFWSPDNLYARLLARIRAGLPRSHGDRLRFLCCVIDGADPAMDIYGVSGLPALMLFHRDQCVRRWIGALDVGLLRFELELAMSNPAL